MRLPNAAKHDRMLALGAKVLVSYFIGSIMGSIVVGRFAGGVDIRTMGSGNAGGTNALRTQGIGFALGVVIIDIGKGVVGAGVVPGLTLPFIPEDPAVSRAWLTVCCAIAAVLGHVWPVYHHFRGGKGAATYIGTLIVLAPQLLIVVLAVFAAVLAMFGFVGLATMSAAVAVPVWIGVTTLPAEQPLFIYTALIAGCIIYWHRSNIARMRAGNENRATRAMLSRGRSATSRNEPQ